MKISFTNRGKSYILEKDLNIASRKLQENSPRAYRRNNTLRCLFILEIGLQLDGSLENPIKWVPKV